MVRQLCVKVGSHWVNRGMVNLSNNFELREKRLDTLDTEMRLSGFPIYQLTYPGYPSNAELTQRNNSHHLPLTQRLPSPRGPIPVLN